MFIEHRIEVRGLDKVLSFLYRWVFWPFFTRPTYAFYVVLATLGTAAFAKVLLTGQFQISDVFTSGGSVAYGAAALGMAFAVMAGIHQLSHIFAAKALGREVPAAGFMITYGLPFVFAQTTDVWLEGRYPRMLCSLAGTISDVLVGSTAAMFLILFPESDWAPLVFKLGLDFTELFKSWQMVGIFAVGQHVARHRRIEHQAGEIERRLRCADIAARPRHEAAFVREVLDLEAGDLPQLLVFLVR